MRALQFEQTGSINHLKLVDLPVPVPAGADLLVKVEAAAINPSDIKNVLGLMHETSTPRIPGRDFAGRVVGGPATALGQAVFGTGGDLGFGRDGSHAEFLTVPTEAAVPMPKGLSFAQAAAIGVPYLAAAAVVHRAKLLAGETILILGTKGAVGSAACRLAHRIGARVIGVVRSRQELSRPGGLPVSDWIDLESTDLVAGCRALTGGRGADVVLDTIGGAMFERCLGAIARQGRQIAVASGGMPRVSFNLIEFYHNESHLIGVDSLKWGFAEAGQVMRDLTPGFESGEFPPPEVLVAPLEHGPDFYRQVEAGKAGAKIVLVP